MNVSYIITIVLILEVALLAFLALMAHRIHVRSLIISNQRKRLHDDAQELIKHAEEEALRTLRTSARYSEKMLGEAADIRQEIRDEIVDQIDATAHTEKLLFKESLTRSRRENVAGWDALQKELNERATKLIKKFNQELEEQLHTELQMVRESSKNLVDARNAHFAKLVSEKVDTLARQVLNQSIPIEKQRELVERAIASYEK